MSRRPLTEEEKADADRLKDAWLKFKAKHRISQEEMAHRCGWKAQGAFSQYVLGRIPLNMEALVRMSAVMGIDPATISPRLFTVEGMNVIRLEDRPKTLQATDELLKIPIYDVELSAGKGLFPPSIETVLESLYIDRDWFRRTIGVAPHDLLGMGKVSGDSMLSTFASGDLVLIDFSDIRLSHDGIYIIAMDSSVMIKRLSRRPSNKTRIISDNERYENFTIDNSEFEVKGRVLTGWHYKKYE